jgi:hypothetical protein
MGRVTCTGAEMPAIELDHIFVCASPGGEEARALAEFGLSEGTPNVHPGQGTACRRFFFRNGYLELLWVTDPAEAQSAAIRPTHLWERWNARSTDACPFGLGFRPSAREQCSIPFPSWEYRPPYLPESWSFHVGTNASVLKEPMLFYLPFSRRPDSDSAPKRQVVEHAAGLRELTRVELISPHAESLSTAFEALLSTGVVRRRAGAGQFVELGFDGESKGRMADFRPGLPIVFCW